jgi:predicted PurR-regulated permease PerM
MFIVGNYLRDKFEIFMHSGYNMLEETIDVLCNKVSSIIKIDITVEGIKSKGAKLISGEFLRKGAIYTTEGIFSYFIANIAVYFMLVDKTSILSFIGKLINNDNLHLVQRKYKDINKLLKIEFSLILITTMETIFGFYALDIENALVLGIFSGILDLLPYVGIIIVFIPLIMYKISLGQYIIVIGLIFLFILLTISRQIMEAKFMSHNLKIHPLPVILSLYIGLNAFGVIGLFIGPIYVITAKEIIMSS